jgi:SAM-dependent methyltransferase
MAHQKYENFGQVTGGRLFLNKELLPRFAYSTPDGAKILFVGVHMYWDYECFFNNPGKLCIYETLDKHPGGGKQPKPTYNMSIEGCPEIKDDTFDRVIMIGVYEFIDRKPEAFSEINRILKPGGRALLSVPGRGYYPDDNRAMDPWQAWEKVKPLRVLEVYTTYENEPEPTSIQIIVEKGRE